MRLISLQEAAARARETLVRFPLVLFAACVAAGYALALVGHSGDDTPRLRGLLAALLGLPLLTAVATTGERAGWRRATRTLVGLTALLLPVGFWWASGTWTETTRTLRFAQLSVALHLLAATLPYLGTTAQRGFWQYNRIQFLRFLTAALFAGVLFGGLAIALLAIDNLFGVRVDEDWYARMWIVIGLVFHPWFFLGGLPRDLNALEAREDYPGGIKVFAQFILIPVVTVYLMILTAYLVRVLVTRTWPSGWIGYLVSSVAAAGTLALLLVHPVRERSDSRWVDNYGRWFYVALLPSIAMLLMAIWLRVDQYGLTEPRYFLTIVALWLAGIALYYGFTGSRNIRVIPTTLGALALLAFVGPWSAYSVSRLSQLTRLRHLLRGHEMLTESRLQPPAGEVGFEARREMSAVLRYLIDTHGARSLGRIAAELRQAAEEAQRVEAPARATDHPSAHAVMDRMGVAYVERWQETPEGQVSYFADLSQQAVPLDGYEWLGRLDLVARVELPLGPDTLAFTPKTAPSRTVVSLRGKPVLEISHDSLLVQARTAMTTTPAGGKGRPLPLTIDAEGEGLRLRLLVSAVSGRGAGATAELHSSDALVLLRLSPEPR